MKVWNSFSVGKTGIKPNLFLLQTTDDISVVLEPGYAEGQPMSPGDLVFASFYLGGNLVGGVLYVTIKNDLLSLGAS